ncbi:DUF2634 domain-containing protein [Bacillus sp. S/N-304-OC-R1]|uniref:DUF2634 domain-containing protein n=1 Tax=Bacillus sp. S/N-304-OC-R1 TaxID=2758034 RepID=UPI001C8E8F2D|nr:DUF2634 domain-containing protein [Bacillus sp. S/N-304-OC-R1]MBY0122146.1 DUF2634 domain-containing protein [Bacillus sp. S/N-304-OC-R1]
MIPQVNDGLIEDFEEALPPPTKNFKLYMDKDRCLGFVDEIEALKQAIFLMLNIERYDYIIYSWIFGVEFKDLFGKPTAYVLPEIKRRIKECLMQDDRINSVDNFIFDVKKKKVHVTFTVHSIYGEFTQVKEVEY